MKRDHPDEAARERIVAHALELLVGEERDVLEEHLASCAACRAELAFWRPLAASLTDASSGDRSRGVGLQPWRHWRDPEEPFVPAASPWESSGLPGVESRRLSVDRARDRVTMLVRMAPGATYPAHVHRGPEECYVVEGDLRVGGDVHLRAGDFQRVVEGSRHPAQSTDGGCLLLISCSLHDELQE